MRPASHAEGTERPGGRHPRIDDTVDDRRRRPVPQPIEERLKTFSRAFRDTPDGSVARVRHPAFEPEIHRLAKDEVAKADPLDAADHRGIQANDRRLGVHDGRSGGGAAWPAEHERVEDELR